jgi:hypothetical protein
MEPSTSVPSATDSSSLPERPGYLSEEYAASLSDGGVPLELPRSGAFLLLRPIPGAGAARDAMGGYPIFCCRYWPALLSDLGELTESVVSMVAVTDPFGDYSEDDLRRCFPERVTPFKRHFTVDLGRPLNSFVSAHHRRYARAASRAVTLEHCRSPLLFGEDFCGLYDGLIARHRIRGIAAFSRSSLHAQLAVPGVDVFRAHEQGETVGMVVFFRHGDVAYYHLAAYTDRGYRLRASFALFWYAFEWLASVGVRQVGLGAGAGIGGEGTEGLVRFKAGWANGTRQSYLCGRIFEPDLYVELARTCGAEHASFFPAYRAAEAK